MTTRWPDLLKRLYRRSFGHVITVGLGQSLSDAALLQRVDYPIVVQNAEPGVTVELLKLFPTARLATAGGQGHWVDAITEIVRRVRQERPSEVCLKGGTS